MRVDGDTTYVTGMAVPYGVATTVAERGPGGEIQLFREQFTQHSWADMPDRVALTKTHNEDQPLGWCRTRNTKAGLMFEAELITSTMAADAVAAIKAGLIRGLSVAFAEDPSRDQWQRGSKGQPPMVHRMGATLRHVALVANPCYPSAQVATVGAESWAHIESEQWQAPYRAERARAAAARKAEDAKILADTDRICPSVPLGLDGTPIDLRGPQAAEHAGGGVTALGAILPSTGATVVTMGPMRITVAADEWAAPHLAEQYREAVVSALRVKGAALSRAEMDEIRSAYSVLA